MKDIIKFSSILKVAEKGIDIDTIISANLYKKVDKLSDTLKCTSDDIFKSLFYSIIKHEK